MVQGGGCCSFSAAIRWGLVRRLPYCDDQGFHYLPYVREVGKVVLCRICISTPHSRQ